jgi:hypothetical protein
LKVKELLELTAPVSLQAEYSDIQIGLESLLDGVLVPSTLSADIKERGVMWRCPEIHKSDPGVSMDP